MQSNLDANVLGNCDVTSGFGSPGNLRAVHRPALELFRILANTWVGRKEFDWSNLFG